jgi:predicted HTH domain antitoxin
MDKTLLDTLSRTQKITLLLLEIDSIPIKGKVWFQKEIFLISKLDKKINEEIEFEPHHYGPHSYEAQDMLEDLEAEGLIEIFDNEISITKEGKELAGEIKKEFKSQELEFYKDIKDFLNDLTRMELLSYIYSTNKDMTTQSVELENVKKRIIEYAIALFKKKKLSFVKAAKIAGIPVSRFVSILKERGLEIETGV